VTGPALLPDWAQLEQVIPQITAPMRRYLEQVACVLRPGSVSGADLALRSFAAFLAEAPSPPSRWPRSPAATSRTSSPGWPPARGRTSPG
jgi:hypothetical protein